MKKIEAAADWVDSPWLSFDTETTGVSTQEDRIVTAAALVRVGGFSSSAQQLLPDQLQTWLANPGIPIPERASAIHGITTEHAREHGGAPAEVLEEINQQLAAQLNSDWPVIVFNAGFDLPLLTADSKRHDVKILSDRVQNLFPVIDPLVLDRVLDPYRGGKRTLSDLCTFYAVPVSKDAHQAHVDAEMTLNLLAKIVDAYPKLQEMPANELHQFQVDEHAKWATNLEAWHRKNGRNRTVSKIWF